MTCDPNAWTDWVGYGRWIAAVDVIPPEPPVHDLIELMEDNLGEIETEDWRDAN